MVTHGWRIGRTSRKSILAALDPKMRQSALSNASGSHAMEPNHHFSEECTGRGTLRGNEIDLLLLLLFFLFLLFNRVTFLRRRGRSMYLALKGRAQETTGAD